MYQTELEYTYSEYIKMQKRLHARSFIFLIIIIGIIMLVTFSHVKKLDKFAIAIIVIFGIIPIFIKTVETVIRIKLGWILDKKTDTVINRYTFFEHHFEMKNEKEVYNINYHDIGRIVETKTHFYIILYEYNNFIIKKENCSDELIQLIRKYKN